MRATDVLSSDHRLIERFIGLLEEAARSLDSPRPVSAEWLLAAVRFIRGFADGLHHHKEEDVLFATLAEHGMSRQQGPVAVMLFEHERGRQHTARLHAAATALAGGDASAAGAAMDNAFGYAGLLRQHIAKEDHILFPMAGRVIPAALHDEVDRRCDAIEAAAPAGGTRSDYEALVDRLEAELATVPA